VFVAAKSTSYKDLIVWQRAVKLADAVYEVTLGFPDYEKFSLANQLRRASVSIPSNIAEGSVRGKKDFARFILMARGSLAEVETQLIIAKNRNFIPEENYKKLENEFLEISKMLMSLHRSMSIDQN
jgi:four helix bundle protein